MDDTATLHVDTTQLKDNLQKLNEAIARLQEKLAIYHEQAKPDNKKEDIC